MRVNSINVAQPRSVNYNLRKHNVQNPVANSNPNFKGLGGAGGTIVGALLGVGLTAVSGGALAWTIPVLGGACGIGGDMYEKKDEPKTDQYGREIY